jgi:hypothetical protein
MFCNIQRPFLLLDELFDIYPTPFDRVIELEGNIDFSPTIRSLYGFEVVGVYVTGSGRSADATTSAMLSMLMSIS